MNYLFPFEKVRPKSKIVLYGSGEVGYDFYQQVKTSDYCKIICWVDRQYKWYQYLELPISSPNGLDWSSAEAVVVAVTNQKHFVEIKRTLMELSVPEHKIVWKENYRLTDIPVARLDEEKRKLEAYRTRKCEPEELLTDKRMDIVIRYLYAKELLQGIVDGEGCHLYEKHFEMIGDEEPVANKIFAFFSDYKQKRGIETYKNSFQDLLESMKKNGFQKEYFIPLDKNGEMINGAHRLAVALAMEIPVWVADFSLFEGFHFEFSVEWLKNNCFNSIEIQQIMNAYINLRRK